VQRVAAIAAQVRLLRAGHDEDVQPGGTDDRAHRVHPRTAIGPDGGKETEADPDLIQLTATHLGEGGLQAFEFAPGDHLPDVTQVSLTSSVSDCAYTAPVGVPHALGDLGLVNKAGTWYLVAVVPGRPVIVFRAARIRSARMLTTPAERPDGFDLGGTHRASTRPG
jgi:WYL domain